VSRHVCSSDVLTPLKTANIGQDEKLSFNAVLAFTSFEKRSWESSYFQKLINVLPPIYYGF